MNNTFTVSLALLVSEPDTEMRPEDLPEPTYEGYHRVLVDLVLEETLGRFTNDTSIVFPEIPWHPEPLPWLKWRWLRKVLFIYTPQYSETVCGLAFLTENNKNVICFSMVNTPVAISPIQTPPIIAQYNIELLHAWLGADLLNYLR